MQQQRIEITLQGLQTPTPIETNIKDAGTQPISPSPLVLSKLQVLAESDRPPYPSTFVLRYLILKMHSIHNYGRPSLSSFLIHLIDFYNAYLSNPQKHVFRQSHSDAELMAQILLQSGTYQYLDEWELEEVLESAGLVIATMVEAYFEIAPFLKKNQYVVTLSLVSLYARTLPFVSIVHTQKNHKGECDFAASIFQLMQLDPNVKQPSMSMVQDAYSLRCTPHVHGVVYECMNQIREHLQLCIGKPLMKTIWVNKHEMRNLLFRSQTETLMLDQLILALNQIGHMSFLRCERILNPHLTCNNISQSPLFETFRVALAKASYHVVSGKLLAAPTNADTVIMDNYSHDIYFNDGATLVKLQKMLAGLTELMVVEVMEAIDVLGDVYGKGRLFKSDKMQEIYHDLARGKDEGYLPWSKKVKEWVRA